MVAVSVEQIEALPYPTAGVTITGLGAGTSQVTVWRVADGERNPVRGARRAAFSDAAYVEDFDVPLGRSVSYEVEVIAGPSGASRVISNSVTVDSDAGWIMDPLIPQSGVRIQKRMLPSGEATFTVDAMKTLDYAAEMKLYTILGSNKPMVLFGQRMAAAGVDFSIITDAAEENARLSRLLTGAGQLLVRVPASWGAELPGTWFAAVGVVSKEPHGGALTTWSLTGDTVQAPTIKVLTASFTYGDVALLTETYGQKQSRMAGKTYLDDLKNPLG